jgi:hypothetical protein
MQVQAGLVVGGAANILMLWQVKYALVGRLYLLVQAMFQNAETFQIYGGQSVRQDLVRLANRYKYFILHNINYAKCAV